jgi:hypothetical protein
MMVLCIHGGRMATDSSGFTLKIRGIFQWFFQGISAADRRQLKSIEFL